MRISDPREVLQTLRPEEWERQDKPWCALKKDYRRIYTAY